MLKEDYADKIDDEGKRLLAVIRDNSRRMGELIDDLLAFSRLGRQSIQAVDVDMVPLDVKMPKVDGIEVLRRICEDANLRAVPVVMLTSSAEERDVVESYRLGANSYIVMAEQMAAMLHTASPA